ncbi:MAG: nuclear transport factor 2 family protein [Acidobacteriota bacterium]
MHRALSVILVLMSSAVPVTADEPPAPAAVAERYLETTFGRDYDALMGLYAADAVFHDPTADVFQGPVSEGPVRGAAAIVAMQKSWGLGDVDFQPDDAFTVGEHTLHRGTLTVAYAGSEQRYAIPFVNVLRVVDGRVVERLDFAEYVETFDLGDAFEATSAATRQVADPYLAAYLEGDLDTQSALMAATIHFQDPTAAIVGGDAPIDGAEKLLASRRAMYSSVASFELDVAEQFVSNHHAVYMGTVRYQLTSGQRFEQPAVAVIEVHDGKVTRHWDFVDYDVPPVTTE